MKYFISITGFPFDKFSPKLCPVMNIQLNNFGPIKKFDFDLSKDLTILFGKNNIGKSYAISAIYLILKCFRKSEFADNPVEIALYYYRKESNNNYHFGGAGKIINHILPFEEAVTKALEKDEEINITKDLVKLFTNIISDLTLHNLEKSFINSYDSLDSITNKLSNEKFSIILKFKDFEFTISLRRDKMVISNLKFYDKIIIKKSIKSKKAHKQEGSYISYYNTSKKDKYKIIDSLFLGYYYGITNEITEVLNNIYFLPASRSGLYQALSAFNAVIAELSRSRSFLSSKFELPNISEPVLDYFLSLANVNNKRISKKFTEIVKLIETKILGGTVTVDEKTKKLVFKQQNIDGTLDLSFASSMISEIAPIVAFLKYIITDLRETRYGIRQRSKVNVRTYKPSNLIFIEEPEAHLHPEIQVKMMEIFYEIIKYDVKIVMTSHSNYMLNKLSNLVLDSKINYEKIGSSLMIMGESGSYTDKISMAADREGLIDNNFADVAEDLYSERISLYEKLNDQNAS